MGGVSVYQTPMVAMAIDVVSYHRTPFITTGLRFVRGQAIIWTNVWILMMWPQWVNCGVQQPKTCFYFFFESTIEMPYPLDKNENAIQRMSTVSGHGSKNLSCYLHVSGHEQKWYRRHPLCVFNRGALLNCTQNCTVCLWNNTEITNGRTLTHHRNSHASVRMASIFVSNEMSYNLVLNILNIYQRLPLSISAHQC